ncbi:MAG: glycosyltransferase [Flavobacteriales bacterium]
MQRKKRIAIYQAMTSGRVKRGPKVFFPTFFQQYTQGEHAFELFYFIKTNNPAALRVDYAHHELDHANVIYLREFPTRLHSLFETLELLYKLIRYRIHVFHVLSYSNRLDPRTQLRWMQWLQSILRIKRVFTVTYDGIPTAHGLRYTGRYNLDVKYENLFRKIHFHGIYSWYDDFVDWVKTSGVFEKQPLVKCIHSRFCDTNKYRPESKEQHIVWASALVDYKRPDMFIQAVAILHAKSASLFSGWQVTIYGDGKLKPQYVQMIESLGLQGIIQISSGTNNLAPILNSSSCYVSTQELENFPSLAMNEAMAAGNVIIACNVGRTSLFVKDGKNGYLARSEDAQGIAEALEKFLTNETQHEAMMKYSRMLCDTVHTPANFISEIDAFWTELIQKS